MSDASSVRMIGSYMDEAAAPLFLASFFQSPPSNFHSSEFVEIDIERDDVDVAIAVHDITTGARKNEANQYTNKRFKPPVFKEEGAISAWELLKRQAGMNPFEDPEFGVTSTRQTFSIMRKLERKIRRAIELMASQVLQTGVVTLTDAAAAAIYTLDYQQKDTHRANAAVTWTTAGAGSPLTDLEALADVVRKHGNKNPDTLIFGSTALQLFFANTQVKAQLDNRRMDRGQVQIPSREREGAKYHGTIAVGNRLFEIWLYDGYFRDPATGAITDYVGANNVVMLTSSARLDLTFGACPMFKPEARAMSYLPTDFQDASLGLALTVNSFIANDNTALMAQIMSRPLIIPTAIDTFGVLSTIQA